VNHLPGVRILWEADIHDGEPISGLAEHRGRQGWFQAVFDALQDEWEYPRRLILYRLNDDELAEEWRQHRAWEIRGSTNHCRHDDIPILPPSTEESLQVFNAMYPARPLGLYEDHHAIGWFWASEG